MLIEEIWARVKFLKWPLLVLAAVAAILAAWMLLGRGCGGQSPAASQSGDGIPLGWHQVAVVKTPLIGHNEASEATAAFPPGSTVIHLETQEGGQYDIGIMPGGEVVVPDNIEATVTVYKKRERLMELEARPWLGVGAGRGGGYASGGLDVLRLWRVHAGVGAAISTDRDVGLVGSAAVNIWRNVDFRLVGGYGTGGEMAAAEFSIAIE